MSTLWYWGWWDMNKIAAGRNLSFDLAVALLLSFLIQSSPAGTTGKIAGRVWDASSHAPLVGAQILIEGTSRGAVCDAEGRYLLLNLPPGRYRLSCRMVGYERQIIEEIAVSADYTTAINFSLRQTVIAGESITIIAAKPLIQNDMTFSTASLSESRIAELPAEEMARLLQLQAGVTIDTRGQIHMRGGRATEVAYLVDGMAVTDGFDRSQAIEVDNSGIQELQVISGTFNAEYGQAQSGVVNIVTKKGTEQLSGTIGAYAGDYLSNHKALFYNIDAMDPLAERNIIASLSGPIPLLSGTFFLAGRRAGSDGWLYGRREFSLPVDDPHSEGYTTYNSHAHSGDSAWVAMNNFQRHTLQGSVELTHWPALPIRYTVFYSGEENGKYDQRYARFPEADSRRSIRALAQALNFSYSLSARSQLSLSLSQLTKTNKRRLFADPYDERYLFPAISTEQIYQRNAQENLEYVTDASNNEHSEIRNRTAIARLELTSQVHPIHLLKTGIEVKRYRLGYSWREIVNRPDNKIEGLFIPYLAGRETTQFDEYTNKPVEAALFVQDKIEYKEIVVNAGLRFDYFDAHGSLPSVPDQKAGLVLSAPRRGATVKTQLSPRLGLAFPISDQGVIHFSYGHFSQIPDFKSLYWNSEYEIKLGALSTMVGNPDLKPETTVSWEAGLQHQLAADVAVDATVYFKDIKNLLGQEIIRLKGGQAYARYINRDYGNVRGFVIALEKRPAHGFAANIDYTFQIARGNASDPFAVFTDNQGTPPRESEKQVLPLDWDQRHTLNASVTFATAADWGISLIFQAGSGLPYTPTDPDRSLRTAFENSARKPLTFNCDLAAHYDLRLFSLTPSFFFKVYNLFDQRNEIDVFTDTGRASFTHTLNYQLGDRRPDFYSAPRLVMAGVRIGFGGAKGQAR